MSDTAPLIARGLPVGGPPGSIPELVRRVLVRPPDADQPPRDAHPDADGELEGAPPVERQSRGGLARVAAHQWHRFGLAAVLLLSGVLNLFRLDQEGNANQYYTATVFSMIQNWHAFFFASFDSAGYVTVDKPPLGFWIQAASAKLLSLFGVSYSGLSVLLPEALAGVASVAVLYMLVRRAFGPVT